MPHDDINPPNLSTSTMFDCPIVELGCAEIHAALAAAFYADKHALKQAEQQFTLASLLDKRYTDAEWVVSDKHWPPSLVVSLRQFLDLS